MSTVSHHTISLDGYVAGPGDSVEWSFDYGEATSLAAETMNRIGAILAGRRWFELARERWNGVDGIYGGAFEGTVFVLSHRPAPDDHDPRIEFLGDALEAAVQKAQAAAGEKDVGIFGGSLTDQCLQAGLLAEIVMHIVPVLLGGGVRLFGDGGERRIELERISVGEADRLTDLHYRVVK